MFEFQNSCIFVMLWTHRTKICLVPYEFLKFEICLLVLGHPTSLFGEIQKVYNSETVHVNSILSINIVEVRMLLEEFIDIFLIRWYFSVDSWHIHWTTKSIWSKRYNSSQKTFTALKITHNWPSRITLNKINYCSFIFLRNYFIGLNSFFWASHKSIGFCKFLAKKSAWSKPTKS